MKEKNEKSNANAQQPVALWKPIAQLPFVQGPLLGAGVMTAVTPLLNWTNHVMNRTAANNAPMMWRHSMSGCVVYGVSAVPSYATVFAIKKLFQPEGKKTTPWYDFATSFTAGALSGLASTPFDAVAVNKKLVVDKVAQNELSIAKAAAEQRKLLEAQNEKLKGLTSTQKIRQLMVANNGYRALMQGGGVTAAREGLWSLTYLSVVPHATQYLSSVGIPKKQAEPAATIAVAGSFGLFTTALNQLRFRKQKDLTEKVAVKSYVQHARDIWNQDANASWMGRVRFFFKGGLPRTITAVVAGGLLVKGNEAYTDFVSTPKSHG